MEVDSEDDSELELDMEGKLKFSTFYYAKFESIRFNAGEISF